MSSPTLGTVGLHSLPMLGRIRSALLAASFLCATAGYAGMLLADESPDAILQHARAVYAGLTSYEDSGTVLKEYSATSRDQNSFATYFNRSPRRFLFDYRKQGGDRLVIWGDPEAFHTWWKTTAQVSDYPNPNNVLAFTLNDFPTDGSVTKIPTLLYHNDSLVGALSHFSDARVDGNENIGGQNCYRLVGRAHDLYGETGKEVNARKLTLWVDMKSYLVRQVREESPAAAGSLDRTTTTYVPTANPAIADARFKFAPPSSE